MLNLIKQLSKILNPKKGGKSMFSIESEKRDNILILKLKGELVCSEEKLDLSVQILKNFNVADNNLIIDLSGIKKIDSSGVGSLINLCTDLLTKDINFVLCRANGKVDRFVEITRLKRVFNFYKTIKEAVESFKKRK